MTTSPLTFSLGSDHAGFHYKEVIKQYLAEKGQQVLDFGTDSDVSCDYPEFIRPAAEAVARGDANLGIVLGGSGNGEAMAANKVRGVRCAVCWTEETARLAKEHNNANMLSIGARMVSEELALRMIDTWLAAAFAGGRHQRRIDAIEP